MSRLKKTLRFFKGGGYTKGEICTLLGIGRSTLSLWLQKVKLPLQDRDGEDGRAPHDQPLSIDDILTILYAWIAIHHMHWGYILYRKEVVQAGKARAFEKVYAKRTGGGSLKEALELILSEGVIYHSRKKTTEMTDSQKMAVEFLIDHLTEKYGDNNNETNRTSNQPGDERERNSRSPEDPRAVVG